MAKIDTVTIGGTATVEEILSELGLAAMPTGCTLKLDDEIEINVTADKSEVIEELSEDFEQRDCEAIRAGFEEIRKGDFATALSLFSRAFTEVELTAAETGLRGQHSAGDKLQPSLPLAAPAAALAA
jgi:hypothetical protein